MDLTPYNPEFVPPGCGLPNLGNTCYFNSLLQCLLSCSSIYEILDRYSNEEHIKKNPIIQHLIAVSAAARRSEDISKKCITLWRDIITVSRNRKDNIKLDHSNQHDMHEGLMMFLDIIDDYIPEVRRLFEHRQCMQIICSKCQTVNVNKREINLVFDVQSDLKTEQHENFKSIDAQYNQSTPLNEFLLRQNGYVDGFRCTNEACKSTEPKYQTTKLVMVPEILAINLKKYGRKVITPFTDRLEFNTTNNKKITYKLVAQSEHAGSMAGGHYWAVCLRKENDKLVWKYLNDSSVSDGKPGPTPNTYVLFYHCVNEHFYA